METHNIISTPNLTGNIGACTISKTVADSTRVSFLKYKQVTLTVNSCTGEMLQFETINYSPSGFILLGMLLVFIWAWKLVKVQTKTFGD